MSLPLPFKELTQRLAALERKINEQEKNIMELTEACKRKKPGPKPKAQDAE